VADPAQSFKETSLDERLDSCFAYEQRSNCAGCRDFKPLLTTFSLYFQIRDDYANLKSDEVRVCLHCLMLLSLLSVLFQLPLSLSLFH